MMDFVSWDDDIPNWMEKIKVMFQTTNLQGVAMCGLLDSIFLLLLVIGMKFFLAVSGGDLTTIKNHRKWGGKKSSNFSNYRILWSKYMKIIKPIWKTMENNCFPCDPWEILWMVPWNYCYPHTGMTWRSYYMGTDHFTPAKWSSNEDLTNHQTQETRAAKTCIIWQCVKRVYPCSSHQNSWDLWMFIPLKIVLIGIDP